MAEHDVSDRLAEVAAREKNATPRPWWQGPHYRNDVHSTTGRIAQIGQINAPAAIDNAAFIAHARQDVPWLIEQLSAYRQIDLDQDAVNTRLADELAQVKAENERIKAGWQPIETAPLDLDVLVITKGLGARDYMRTTVARRNQKQWLTTPGRYAIHATHWMPLPDAPST